MRWPTVGHEERLVTLGGKTVTGGEVEVTKDISMGFLLIKLERNPGKTVRLRFRDVDTEIENIELSVAA